MNWRGLLRGLCFLLRLGLAYVAWSLAWFLARVAFAVYILFARLLDRWG